jgi:tryptophan 2,3-dioxygenase
MSVLTDLIHELTIATGQMKQAAVTDDWLMVERIQKRRSRLLDQITSHSSVLNTAEIAELRAVHEQEAAITARAGAHHQALREALAADPQHPKKPSRMRKAYGDH